MLDRHGLRADRPAEAGGGEDWCRGRGVRVSVEDLNQFIESRRTEPVERVKQKRVVLKHLR